MEDGGVSNERNVDLLDIHVLVASREHRQGLHETLCSWCFVKGFKTLHSSGFTSLVSLDCWARNEFCFVCDFAGKENALTHAVGAFDYVFVGSSGDYR